MDAEDREDLALIEEMLRRAEEDRELLSRKERFAFADMRSRLNSRSLSENQRDWIRTAAERLGVIGAAPARNVFSKMPQAKQAENMSQVRTRFPWEQPGYEKATKPPGRRTND